MVEMCSYISELNELQISVECLESLVGLDNYYHYNYYYRSPREFMSALQRVEMRVKHRLPLTQDENIIWVMVRDKMRHMVLEGMAREFVARSGDSAACTIVSALGYRYGFCTYLYLLGFPDEEHHYYTTRILERIIAWNQNQSKDDTHSIHKNDDNTSSIGSKEATLVIHLDLFNMKCNAATLQALCSEYVRNFHYHSCFHTY